MSVSISQGRRNEASRCQQNGQRNVLAAAASGVCDFISGLGGDWARVLGQAGVPDQAVGDPALALDLGDYCQMMELAAADTGHDNFGLWFGQQFRPQALGLIGEIALAAPNLGAAIDNLAALFPYHQQATETRLRPEGEWLRLEYRILDGRILNRRQDAELTMGMFANVFRAALGPDWAPIEVHLEHARPADWRQHQDAFGAPVHFGQHTNCLVFSRHGLDRPMPAGDLARLDALRRRLTTLAGGTGAAPFLDRVKAEIRSRLAAGYPHVEEVAESLGLARWTLQRRLVDLGISFSDAVELVRRDLAGLYMPQRHLALADIAELLGYSEPSAFSRAFRRWFGTSPQGWRTRHGAMP